MTGLIAAIVQLLLVAAAWWRDPGRRADRIDHDVTTRLRDLAEEAEAKDDHKTEDELRSILGG